MLIAFSKNINYYEKLLDRNVNKCISALPTAVNEISTTLVDVSQKIIIAAMNSVHEARRFREYYGGINSNNQLKINKV